MNTIRLKDILSTGVLMMVEKSAVQYVAPKSPISVHLDWDLLTVKHMIYIIFTLIKPFNVLWIGGGVIHEETTPITIQICKSK